ncbi:MAG: hypothetical protein RSG78_07060 [Oscillospiraceae bacterium]
MKRKKVVLAFSVMSIISLYCYIGTAAYGWGYMQSAIDNRVAAFSAPACVAAFWGIPFIIAAVIFAIAARVIIKRK